MRNSSTGELNEISNDYDPAIVFHSHSTNLPHLSEWIESLISLTETSLPSSDHPSTDQLVESLQRYDAMFVELLNQVVNRNTILLISIVS